MKAPEKKRTAIPAVFAVCLMIAAAGCGCKGKKTADQTAADPVAVKVVAIDIKQRPFEDWGSYSADLRGFEDAVLVAPNQGGRVDAVREVGTRFRAGESLCNIDGEKYGAALEAAKAQVEVTKGDLERAKVNVEKGSLGRSVLDATNLAYQNARMMLATAQRAYEDCRCQAPFDGVLASRSIDKYQTVTPGSPTVRVSRIDRLQAVIAIPETEAFGYEEGMKTEFRLLQHPERAFEGRLMSRDQAVDARSRTVTARIVVTNSDGSLRPGMVGRASILRKKYASAIVIPSAALVHLQNGVSVMIVENGLAKQHTVQIGSTSGDSTLVTAGLSEGDKLVVTGAFQLSDGTKVSF
jgi:RND family efflux transporter MFP subunit